MGMGFKARASHPRHNQTRVPPPPRCAMSQILFCLPFLNGIIFFKFYFKNVNEFMFSYFEPNFLEKFHWESGFSNFDHVTILAKQKLVFFFFFLAAILKHNILLMFFLLIYGSFGTIWVYTDHGASFVPKFLREST